MSKESEIESFLRDFKIKLDIWGITYLDRGKNQNTLLELEIRPTDRDPVLKALQLEDYSEGPVEETLYQGADMWVFGKKVKETEIYIKITMGNISNQVLCISFHIAEHEMNYPFKK